MLSLFWGFRLTIWNVNKEGGEQYAWVKWRFRLTIWNVNALNFLFHFYSSICFRLTIWNVNLESGYNYLKENIEF